ncbi:MAG: hypothetical protein JSU87_04260 [Gemmatimonadota bacterium]|nr:MAG: hypothetical protein JSU87_04260 [Gemmatimonadota bacterium]
MELTTLANLAEIISALIVIGGLWFAVVQLLQYRQQRRDMAAIELARSFQSPAFASAFRSVMSLPDGIGAQQLRERDPSFENAAIQLSLTLESVGIMVHRRMVGIETVWELMGGVLLKTWDKLGVWIADVRTEQNHQKFDEWVQWLVEQLRRYQSESGTQPAYILYSDWRP